MDRANNIQYQFTSNEGTNSVWRMAEKVTRTAASRKFLEQLKREEIGVKEVASHAWIRSRNRMSKKGKDIGMMKKFPKKSQEIQEDGCQSHVVQETEE